MILAVDEKADAQRRRHPDHAPGVFDGPRAQTGVKRHDRNPAPVQLEEVAEDRRRFPRRNQRECQEGKAENQRIPDEEKILRKVFESRPRVSDDFSERPASPCRWRPAHAQYGRFFYSPRRFDSRHRLVIHMSRASARPRPAASIEGTLSKALSPSRDRRCPDRRARGCAACPGGTHTAYHPAESWPAAT